MDILLVIIALIFVSALRPRANTADGDYLGRDTTATINGLFMLLVLFSHLQDYLGRNQPLAKLTGVWMATKGELIVTTFLFFSGYGIMTQINKRGSGYLKDFPRRRLLYIWLQLAVAVTLFAIMNVALDRHFAPMKILLAYTGLTSIGNSNWYIFAILLMYLLTYLCFRLVPDHPRRALALLTAATLAYCVIGAWTLPVWFYNTIFCYPAGMAFALIKPRIDRRLQASALAYWGTAVASFVAFVLLYVAAAKSGGILRVCFIEVASILFVWLFVLLAMKVTLRQPWLRYLGGRALFALYMLARIPMIIGQHVGLTSQPVVYALVVLAATLGLGWLFDQGCDRLLRRVREK
ncbi:acyltransferase family protein [Lacticaseibacillus mingshuiensis]|uniref:Acyltransferase family protein n=1 Tax=Lacticaseibacillus mingshuiensis TaxID=2799574 RepID=A0ABW4CJH6_9LACO|nr:acyltransferase family protein [Lacticaseibacillus mingshuiensis]